jgi:pimeloyl-ACP methyl ester carboxylesterase
LRHLADSFARAGAPTIRFDYDGTGDSAGDDTDPDRLGAWIESTRDAVRALRDRCGVERVWLVGIRLGVVVARLAAAAQSDIAGLVAIAPVVAGKAYLRELAARHMTLGLEGPPDGVVPAASVAEGGQEAFGYAITAETHAAVAAIQLAKLPDDLAKTDGKPFEVLVLDRDDLPTAEKWVAQLTAQGVSTESRQLSGYVEMMFDPHKAVVPTGIVDAATEWVSARIAGAKAAEALPESRSVARGEEAEIDGVVETPLFVDDAKLVFGVLSRSKTAPSTGRAILLLNAGSIHHVGPNRLYVRLARAWAAAGHEVVRLDITGVGDSFTRSGQEENVVYSDHAVKDIAAAVEFCRRRGARDIRTVGLCSGAYHALTTAEADNTISGFVAINPLTFVKPPPGPVEFSNSRVARETARYQRAARDPEKWKKLLRGEVHVRVAAETLARHAGTRVMKRVRDVARRLNLVPHDDVGMRLRKLAKSDVEQGFVFASNDPGNQLLRDQAGSIVKILQKQGVLTISTIDGPDHTFTPLWSHEPLISALTQAITPGRAGSRPYARPA